MPRVSDGNSDAWDAQYKAVCRSRITAAEAQGWTGPWRFGNQHLHGTPPNGKRALYEGDHVPERIDNIVIELHRKIADLTYGIAAVRALINESEGVAGLHLNGEVASWDSLQQGGQYEEWLEAFNHAEGGAG